jgi:hypothetical protein
VQLTVDPFGESEYVVSIYADESSVVGEMISCVREIVTCAVETISCAGAEAKMARVTDFCPA